jgi:hypothetical protein
LEVLKRFSTITQTEEYDGSTWTAGGTLNTARRSLGGCGTQTAALGFGGDTPPATGATEEYDGSTWTSNPTGLNTAREVLAGPVGTQTAALGFGGFTPQQQQQQKNLQVQEQVTKTITVS